MEIVSKSFWGKQKSRSTGAYIRRYYLPDQFRFEFRDEDMEAIYDYYNLLFCTLETPAEISAQLLVGPCGIRYDCERVFKEIPSDQILPVIDACYRYHHDRWDWSLSEDESRFLIDLNDRLHSLEHDINTECYRLYQDIHPRKERGEPFLDDYELMVEICFVLHENHPLSRDDDDNIIFEMHEYKTARPDNLEDLISKEREKEKTDWNDARGAENPVIRNNPLFNTPHCWLFHNLQSHSKAPLKHLFGIGSIWVDIKVVHQKVMEINQV
jgi:hypothetical protein